jgi:hypothetical protein
MFSAEIQIVRMASRMVNIQCIYYISKIQGKNNLQMS